MRTDVAAGMILANVVFYFIVLTSAQVLFRHGITNIDSAEQAALALKPLAGTLCLLTFCLWHYRHRTPGDPGIGRVRGLCLGRTYGMGGGVRAYSSIKPKPFTW